MRYTAAIVLMVSLGLSCSETSSEGHATTAEDPDAILFAMSRSDTFLTVYSHNAWTLTEGSECKAAQGDISAKERSILDACMTDAALKNLKGTCSEETYSFRVKGTAQPVCWTKDEKGTAVEGLTMFYEAKVADLAKVPNGECGIVQGLKPSNAGSSAP